MKQDNIAGKFCTALAARATGVPCVWVVIILVIVVAGLAHGLSVASYFSYDDFRWLNCAKAWQDGARSVFSSNPWNTFRPGTHLLILVAYRAFGDWSPGYHLVALILHITASLAAFGLISRLCSDARAGAIGSVLFACGFGHAEGVQWVSAIGFPAAAAFAFLAITAADLYVKRGSSFLLLSCGVMCILATLIHEFAILASVGIVLYAIAFARAERRRRLLILVSTAVVAVVAWSLLYTVFYRSQNQHLLTKGEPSLLSVKHFVPNIVGAMPLLVVPNPHSPAVSHRLSEVSLGGSYVLKAVWRVAVFVLPVCLLGLLVCGTPCQRFGVLWCVVGIALGSLSEVGFASRYLYLPAMGFTLAIGKAFSSATASSATPARNLTIVGIITGVVVFHIGCNVVALYYQGRNAQDRLRLISAIRVSAREKPAVGRLYISGLPDKYRDVLEAARFYGIRATVDTGQQQGRYRRLHYSDQPCSRLVERRFQ